MTESIDMAIAAARERGWIGYEESLAAEVAAMRAERERLFDLVRHQRHDLHQTGLISDEEYADLMGERGDGSVARLEGYDAMRERAEKAEQRVKELECAVADEAAAAVSNEELRHVAREAVLRDLRKGRRDD